MAVRVTRAGVGLTIGIIILAIVVTGGLLIAKQRGEQARHDEAVKVAQQNLDAQNQEQGALNEGDKTPSKSDDKSPEPETDELPATGAGDTALMAVGAGAVTFGLVAYTRSRRALSEAL